MKVGARNQLKGKVTDIKRGDVMAQIKLVIPAASVMGSMITVDSLDGERHRGDTSVVIDSVPGSWEMPNGRTPARQCP